jgi:hypothetical protein
MSKTSILNYHTSIKNIKSGWATAIIAAVLVIPILIFFSLLIFETELAALLMTWFPPAPGQGTVFYRDIIHLARVEILWLLLFFILAGVFANFSSGLSLDQFFVVRSRIKAAYYMMLVSVVFFATAIFINRVVLEDFPNSSDEYAYIFQAEMFSRGKWWERAHDLPDFFYHNNIAQHDGILVSRFPPGWPLLLSTAFDVGLQPSLVNPLLGLIALVFFYFFARKYYDQTVAIWSLVALAFTGFYLFNAASYFSHISCVLATLLFVFSVYLYIGRRSLVYGVLAGFFLGFIVLIRYYTALLIFLPFLVYLLVEYKWKAIPLFFWMGIGSIPCLAYLLWYNYSITGNPFLPVTVWAYPSEQLGFVKGHTFWKGIEHLVRRILMMVYWTSPGLLILYVVFLWRKIKSPAERFLKPEDYAFLTLTIGYFFYYEIGGNQYGPRFLFEGFPFLVVFVVSKVLQTREKWAMILLIVSLIYPVLKLPFVSYRESYIIDQRQDLYNLVRDRKVSNAVVLIASPTSPLRPMPIGDLTRDDARFMNDVIYVRSLPAINNQLMEYYSDRSFYKYVRDIDKPHGELIKIR